MRKIAALFIGSIGLAGPAFAHGMSEADQIRAAGGGIAEFFRQGAVHMVTGYDHLLFLFGVVFFLNKFKDILKFVTAFTLGHCITLIGATFMGIQANYFLVDAVIALTVCYKGFDNVGGFEKYLGMKSPNLLAMVFAFGLIHGFGLSTRLQTLTIGKGFDLLGKILAFNVGVEAGQVAALIVMLALLAGWRLTKSFQRFSMAANTGLIVVGGLLLLMQLHGFQHQSDPMGFYDEKAHQHAHEDLGISDSVILSAGYHVDAGDPIPHRDHDHDTASAGIPAGYHVDPGDPVPHKDHAGEHDAAAEYPVVIDRIFETRKAIKSAKTDEEILDVHHPVAEIHKDLLLLRDMVSGLLHLDLALFDRSLEDATLTTRLIDEQAHEGNVEETRELIARFDESILTIEELINHPVNAGDKTVPAGYHVDPGDPVPHKDHDHGTAEAAIPAGYHVDPGDPVPHRDHAHPSELDTE